MHAILTGQKLAPSASKKELKLPPITLKHVFCAGNGIFSSQKSTPTEMVNGRDVLPGLMSAVEKYSPTPMHSSRNRMF